MKRAILFILFCCSLVAGQISNPTASAAPSGAASGDLSGTYPSPTVSKVAGVTFASYGQCATLDYAICSTSVDASGNPNEIAAGTAAAVTVTGTNMVLVIQGVYQTGTSTYTNVVTGATSSFNYLYVKQDTANANLVAADFAATILAPVYSYKAPGACTGATAGAPQYWLDLTTRQWKVSAAAVCSFSIASPQVLFLGVFWVTAGPVVAGIAHEPYNLSPFRRYELFGDGFDTNSGQGGTDITKQEKTSGTTTLDNLHTYTSFELTGATVVPTVLNNNGVTSGTLIVYSQNPVLIVNTSNMNANGLGKAGGVAATTTCNAGNTGGFGGTGAGGGGASATNAGCAGGSRATFAGSNIQGGGAAGIVGGAGGNGTATPTTPPLLSQYSWLNGASGASGGGDGAASSGGAGGAAGGGIVIRAPSVIEDASSTISANAGAAGAGGGTNGGGGGGGGGGVVVIHAGFFTLSGTETANSTNGGLKAGSGGNGGNGTNGIVQNWKIF